MKYILTEKQVNKIMSMVSEQLPMAADIITSAADFGINIDTTGGALENRCQTKKPAKELVLSIFAKSRGTSGKPKINDKVIQSWVSRINKSIQGAGVTSDLQKTLSEIKTPQQLGAVLIAYETKFKRKLYEDLSSEYTISWDTIWSYVKKFTKSLPINICSTKTGTTTLSA